MAGELVLIVEDNPRNLKLVRDVLNFHGYETLEACTGEAALEIAASRTPDLILMDLRLPGCDGFTALEQLRSNAETSSITVVALTAFAMPADHARCLAAGFDGYLEKPISVATFPDKVASFLGAGQVGRP
jgi:two-component system cell cycle response regulator DivK